MSIYDPVDEILSSLPDMFQFWGAALPKFRETKRENTLGTNGLKSIIGRPHNLYVTEDSKGKIVAYHIDLVYTPFKKEDIRMELLDDMLTISVGGEKTGEKTDEKKPMVYRGISAKPFTFQLYVKNFFDDSEELDTKAIKATASEGILSLTFPLKEKTPAPEPKAVQIKLS